MVCQACGTPIAQGVHFCSQCGAQVGAPVGVPPPVYPQPRMPMYLPRVQRHLQTLGILWCVLGVYRVVTGLMGMIFFRAMATHNFDGWMFGGRFHAAMPPTWMAGLWPLIAVST